MSSSFLLWTCLTMAFFAILYPANAGRVAESQEQDAVQDQQEKTETMDAAEVVPEESAEMGKTDKTGGKKRKRKQRIFIGKGKKEETEKEPSEEATEETTKLSQEGQSVERDTTGVVTETNAEFTIDSPMEETTGKETSDARTDEAREKDSTEAATEVKTSEEEIEKDETEAMDIRPSQAHHTNCTFPDYFCNPTADDLIDRIEGTVSSAEECSHACHKDNSCTFFTFLNFRRSPACFALKSCKERKPRCTVPSNCVSGKKACNDQNVCPKINLKKGLHARWRCEGINPYVEDIPAGTPCHASCPAWENAAGSVITAKSTCLTDSSWTDPMPFPPGPLSIPPVLNKPDGPDMACENGCKPLNMTYNPNLEKGGEFFCNTPLSWSNLPVKIEKSNQCHLLCDKMLVAVTECKDGVWTGNPGLGFWCTEEQEAVGHWED